MYGGGRGGGGGAGRNKLLHTSYTPPSHRTSAPNRLYLGGGSSSGARNRGAPTTATPAGSEETFNLVRRNEPVAFGMVVKLTADFTEEIKKVGAQGGPMRIKFDGSKSSSENVIDVGGKEFKFTWFGDKSDIYEEQQRGDDSNGLLVEYGCSWRKLTVHCILDEATKQQYKKRSEEAARLQRARKAIVLDHESLSTKSQIEQLPAVETNPRMHFRNKKDPFKKHRADPPPVAVGSTPKSAFRSGPPSKNTAKIGDKTPNPTPPGQSTKPFPSGIVNMNNSHATNKSILLNRMMSKDSVASSGKELSSKMKNVVRDTTAYKGAIGPDLMDLQSMLISLLIQNPKGMNIKALEKAVGDKVPNSAKKIEPIINKIATYQAPGRYILKQGVDMESFKKPLPGGGSSSEERHHFSTGHQDICTQQVQEPISANKGATDEVETHAEAVPKDEDELIDIVDIEQDSPDLPGVKKDFETREGPGGSSTESASDSDTDSDSCNSGSDSGSPSRSRSRSPAESESEGSSDSDSDVSSNSKDGSDVDVDVDILGDDDKGPKSNLKVSESGLSSSPVPWRTDEHPVQNGLAYNHDDETDPVEIENDVRGYEDDSDLNVVNNVVPNEGDDQHAEEIRNSSPNHDKLRECRKYIGKLFTEEDDSGEDSLKNDQSDRYERTSGSKSKRDENEYFNGEFNCVKRLKIERLAQPSILDGKDVRVSESPHSSTSDRQSYDLFRGPNCEPSGRANMDIYVDEVHTEPISDSLQLDKKSSSQTWSGTDEHGKSAGHGHKYPEKGFHDHDSFPTQKIKVRNDAQYDHSYVNVKKIPKHMKVGQVRNSNIRSSPGEKFGNAADRSTGDNGRGSISQREPSDLEAGEYCEPLPDDVTCRNLFETRSSFKSDMVSNRGKPGGNSSKDLRTCYSPNKTGVLIHPEKDRHVGDKWSSHHRTMQSQSQPPARTDHDIRFQLNSLTDGATKSRHSEITVIKRGPEVYDDIQRRAPTNMLKKHDSKGGMVSNSTKENRRPVPNNGSRNRRESSSENSSYSKYEKDEPELIGPIRDFSQYEDYVQEYRDKYDGYCSLNKVLESYRNEFQKLGKDLEAARGRNMDRYYNILDQMKESYHLCGMICRDIKGSKRSF